MIRILLFTLLAACLATGMLACGGGGDTGQTQKAPATSTPAPAKPAVLEIVIRPVGNEMKYQTVEFTVKAGQRVKIIMDNIATVEAMQHNVVITKPGTNTNDVGLAAVQAGEAAGYIPESDAILFYTAIAKPGEKTEIEFTAPDPGDYPYVCTFPGHFALMKGVMHSVE